MHIYHARRLAQRSLSDAQLEQVIHRCHLCLAAARDLPSKAAAWRVLRLLVNRRSPEAVARLERERWPDGQRAKSGQVLIWSSEDDCKDTLVPRLIAMGANLSKIHFIQTANDGDGKISAVVVLVSDKRNSKKAGVSPGPRGDYVRATIFAEDW